ncbi:divergent Flap Endonuclease [Carp edema virus]|nr:divergent Flap Endonuclease [Carp edema virus]
MGIPGFLRLSKLAQTSQFVFASDFLSFFKIDDKNILKDFLNNRLDPDLLVNLQLLFDNYNIDYRFTDEFIQEYLSLSNQQKDYILNFMGKEDDYEIDFSIYIQETNSDQWNEIKKTIISVLKKFAIKMSEKFFKPHSILLVDTMILIHSFFKRDFLEIEFELYSTFLRHCFDNVVWIVDGICPIAKCREQLKRRISAHVKSKQWKVPNHKYYFNIFHPKFLELLERFYSFMENDVIFDHTIFGEGDQKIFEYINTFLTDFNGSIYIMSNDWDIFLITTINRHKFHNRVEYISPKGIFDPILMGQVIEPFKLMHSGFLFGTDFYPGISNFYFSEEFVLNADYTHFYLEIEEDHVKIDLKQFAKFLKSNLYWFDYLEDSEVQKFENYIKASNETRMRQFEVLKKIKNKKSDEIFEMDAIYERTFFDICEDKCESCSFKYDEKMIENYLNIYYWTLNYFYLNKKLDKDYCYFYDFAPSVKHVIRFIKNNPGFKFKNLMNSRIKLIESNFYDNLDNYKFINYPYCPKRNGAYRSQLKCKFIKINDGVPT